MAGSSVKIFKKTASDGGLTIYMGQREYVAVDGHLDHVTGVVQLPDAKNRFSDKCVFASLVCVFRHGRKEDETCGLSFSKSLTLDRQSLYPNSNVSGDMTKLQAKLLEKFGNEARPFCLKFPKNAPNSVHITGNEGDVEDMGVSFEVRIHVGDHGGDFNDRKKSTVTMSVRKTQWAPAHNVRAPTSSIEKTFVASKGKLNCEVEVYKEINYHGDDIPVDVSIRNTTSKTVSSIRVGLQQHCELTLIKCKYTCKVTSLETTDGMPLGPENSRESMKARIVLQPLAQTARFKKGLAIDHALSATGDECNLASTSYSESDNPNDLLGIIVSYTIKVTLGIKGMTGSDVVVEVPLKLHHPRPDDIERNSKLLKVKRRSVTDLGFREEFRNKFPAQGEIEFEEM